MTNGEDAALHVINTGRAHPARRYNYWLGGKDHFAADRESGDAIAAVFPSIRLAAQENRRFMRRMLTHLVREAGVRQILDIGTGIPGPDNTHEVAQAIAPETRVVYVDNDPLVLAHARALLTSTTEGATEYIDADLRDPDAILHHPTLRASLDLSEPVALLLIAVLQFIDDEHNPGRIVQKLVEALPPGSYLAISHPTMDVIPPTTAGRITAVTKSGGGVFRPRTRDEFTRFFEGLELTEPGIGSIIEWRPELERAPIASVAETAMYGAVARLR